MAITQDVLAGSAAYDAVAQTESVEEKRHLLRAFRPGVLHYLADAVYVEWEGLREETVINNILTEL